MAQNDFGRTRDDIDSAKLQYINDNAVKYYNQMMEASRSGKPIEDVMDVAGLDALRRFTASAQKAQGMSDNVAEGAGRFVPTVTEHENGQVRGYDLFSLLMKQRVVLLEGQVDDGMASIACASLLYLKSEASGNPDGDITVHINSPGGSILAGLAIYDTMRSIKPKITTIGYGMQASMGSILLVAGDERKMTRNSKFMIHQPLSGNERSTQQTDIEINAELTKRLREDLTDIYVRHTGLNHKYWDIVLERDTWLSAEQAKKMGVIEEIIMGTAKKTLHEEFSHRADNDAKREAMVPKTAAEIKSMINSSTSSSDPSSDSFRIRPELVTALSQFEEFWTPSRIEAEKSKKAGAPKAAANDDKKAAGPVKSAPGSML
jgi:ATP-dependent Clp protease, protease subunit